MASKTYAIIGATGHIGKVLVEALLKKGHQVRAIGRDKSKLKILKDKGAEVFTLAAFDDASALTKACTGCDAAFSFIPPDYQQEDYEAFQDNVGEAITHALINAKVRYVLNLSSVGANLKEGTGPIKGLHRHEERLNAIPNLNVLHLRPGYFMENLYWSINLIKKYGILGTPLRSDLPIPMIATRDIGLKSCTFLEALTFSKHEVFEMIGPKEITMIEAAHAIGKAIGKPDLKYRQFPYQESGKAMLEGGMKPKSVKLLLEMYKTVNEEKILATQDITPEHRGQTTIEQFAVSSFAPELMATDRSQSRH